MSELDSLRARAVELGVETSYWDVEGHYHETPEPTLRTVVDVLDADRHRRRHAAPRAGHRRSAGAASTWDRSPTSSWRSPTAPSSSCAPDDGAIDLPPDLPFGCHVLRGSAGAGEETSTLVVAPSTMPRSDALAGRAGLFVPAYALWEPSSPLPSFAHLAALAAKLPHLGIDVVSTLPLYAAFLDEPFDASPYAPVSRLHWNEVYLDDASVPAAPTPTVGDLIDWQALARRRRRQLLAAASDLDPYIQSGVDRFVAARPDVVDYARFRPARPSPPTPATRPCWSSAATSSPSTSPTGSCPPSRVPAVPPWRSTCRSAATRPATRHGPSASCSPTG